MAKKRLNKKVAFIGSGVFVLLLLVVIGVILHLSRDPEMFIKDGDEAIKTAREMTDEKIKEETYKRAEQNYHKARSLVKNDSHKIEILFKLVDLYIETNQWRNVLGCWGNIIRIDPGNVKARFGRFQYVYIMADSGVNELWQEVESQASQFIEVAKNADLLMEDIVKWQSSGMRERDSSRNIRQCLGSYLYLRRGRANLELTRLGAVTEPDETLARVIDDLEKVQEFEPNNVHSFWYLAQAVKTKGDILAARGSIEEKDKAAVQAREFLMQAVKVAPDNPIAHINLLREKFTQSSSSAQPREQVQLLEDEYLSLVKQFPSSARAYLALSEFYRISIENLDKAVKAIQKAADLDKENVSYAIYLANLLYSKFSIYGQTQDLYRAIEVAKNALTLPDAQEETGPRQGANLDNRVALYTFLANCYIEQVIEPCEKRTEAQKQQWFTNAEQTVHEIEQLLGSGEDVRIVKWRGMLELAKGNQSDAVRKLYAAYEELKALRPPQPPWPSDIRFAQLSYTLAKMFKSTSETGAVAEFLISALYSGITWVKPEARLDYVEVLLKLDYWTRAIDNLNIYDQYFKANARSRTLRINALLGAGQFDEAEKELAKMAATYTDDPNTIKLKLALVQAKIRQVQRVIDQRKTEEISSVFFQDPNTTEETDSSKGSEQLMTDELKRYWIECAGLVEKLLPTDPENTTLLVHKLMLAEPEPHKISQQRRKELEEQALSSTADPIRRATNLGMFYQRHNELDKAVVELKKVFSSDVVRDEYHRKKDTLGEIRTTQYEIVASYLFDVALKTEDWQLAEQIVETAQRENLDGCSGRFFSAHLAVAKGQYQDALAKLNECLKQKPVFSRALILRSTVNSALGYENASIEDAQRAAYLNPLDPTSTKTLVSVLYQRDNKLGQNVSSEQIVETKTTLLRALKANPSDMGLLSFYAEYIKDDEPLRALAIRQNLQKVAPSVQNAVLLARMAMNMALQEENADNKDVLLAIADSSFEQAQAIAPENKAVTEARAEYYRRTGQLKKAEQLVENDKKLLWRHYFQIGKLDEAGKLLEQLYKSQPKDVGVVKGLLLVSERQADRKAVQRYSEEIILLEDSVENHLAQIQTFLNMGLVKDADLKLQSFKEKYPQESQALLLEAWLAMRQGQLKKALKLTLQNLESNQNNAQAWRLRGQIYLLMANYGQAISDLKLSKSLSDDPVTRISLAKAYRHSGRYEDAITELKSTIDMPDAPMEGRLLLEQIYIQLGRKEALKQFYEDTLRKLPDSVLWYNRVGASALAEGQFDRAEKLFAQAWQKSRNSGKGDMTAFDGYLQALLLRAGTPGTGTWDPGKLDKVFEESRLYVDGNFAHIAYLRMAEAKMKLGDKATAVQYCQNAVDKAGKSEFLVANTLQRMYTLLGAEETLIYCKEKLEANPDSLAANFSMFNLTKFNGEYNKAVGYIDKCLLIIGPDSPNRVKYIMEKAEVLALAYNKTSDNNYLKKAIAEYESLLVEMPNNTSVLNNLAYMLANIDDRLAEALQYAERSLQARPDSPDLLDTYAYVLHKNDRNLEAAESLQSALQQYESQQVRIPAEVYEHIGMVNEKLGAKDKALDAYKQALQIGADNLPKTTEQRITSAIERLSQ
ncbi:MAG: tetratricopeptide repeat protein [Phycisphaerae bacterium]|nr:tetratricopeptide repeat protein [Phycisphaerae bacterium]